MVLLFFFSWFPAYSHFFADSSHSLHWNYLRLHHPFFFFYLSSFPWWHHPISWPCMQRIFTVITLAWFLHWIPDSYIQLPIQISPSGHNSVLTSSKEYSLPPAKSPFYSQSSPSQLIISPSFQSQARTVEKSWTLTQYLPSASNSCCFCLITRITLITTSNVSYLVATT